MNKLWIFKILIRIVYKIVPGLGVQSVHIAMVYYIVKLYKFCCLVLVTLNTSHIH